MIKIKHKAFTLSEVLITLAVVGTLAALVVPGLIKDYNSKANMAMLQNMVANLQSAVQTELTKEGATDLDATNIKKEENPERSSSFTIKITDCINVVITLLPYHQPHNRVPFSCWQAYDRTLLSNRQ